ncbi:MAG: C40 family peptidase [Candidatus Pedobacter colombiensis]|uniref:C40 family peptidase n=1 Tax=Candidatus Pedobacter colombiensis TaxID=3121371 RepID=A0AAJ5WAY0_9SPHI|nr:C40 family peptidase [Pedobacter sp.]WEK20069.1 MAG: C40 family peptidase [Pedobacter sp.]
MTAVQSKACCLLSLLLFFSLEMQASVVLDTMLVHKIKAIVERVAKIEAPDQRTDVFNFEITGDDVPALKLETTLPTGAAALTAALKREGLMISIITNLLPAADLQGQVYGVVRLSVANNRKHPSHPAEMVTQMLMGTPVQILKREKGYSLVRSPDRYISWVETDALAVMDKAGFEAWQQADKLMYTADYGTAYSKSDMKSQRVSDLVKGDLLKLIGKESGFYKVAYPDGRIAYILVKAAENYKKWVSRPNPDAAQILATAKTLIGTPYIWGGTSMKGVDCSGFTKTCFFLNGIILPRDASQQALIGESVDIYEGDTVSLDKCLKNLKAGDLLFFAAAKGKSVNPRVTHTAIYMEDGKFIQAAGMVRINSLVPSAPDYADAQVPTLVGARRMLNGIGTPQITRIDQHELYTTTKP